MPNQWLTVVRYLFAGEESRPGRKDYWNHIFLAGKPPFGRKWLERLKIVLVIIFSVCMTAALAWPQG